MGFFSHIAGVVRHVVRNPAKAIRTAIHNPAAKILPHNVRTSKAYKKFARPVIKVGTGAAVGALTGGLGLVGGAVAFTGLSTAGAVAGGISSAAAGGLTSKPFKPVKQVVIPAAAGLVAGNAARGLKAAQAAQKAKTAASAAQKAKTILKAKSAGTVAAKVASKAGQGGSLLKTADTALKTAGTALKTAGTAAAAGTALTQFKGAKQAQAAQAQQLQQAQQQAQAFDAQLATISNKTHTAAAVNQPVQVQGQGTGAGMALAAGALLALTLIN